MHELFEAYELDKEDKNGKKQKRKDYPVRTWNRFLWGKQNLTNLTLDVMLKNN
jgi:hypothetical protein